MEEKDPIMEQYESIQESKKKSYEKNAIKYDKKNYFDIKLNSKEQKKTFQTRIIQTSPEIKTPFTEVYMHWHAQSKRAYVCTKHTKGVPEGTNKNCPFCDIEEKAYKDQKGANEILWKELKDIAFRHKAQKNFIVRVVDRQDQEFGVKFWKINESVYEQILEFYKDNKEDDINIFDKHNGKDVRVTVERGENNKTKIKSVIVGSKQIPLAETEEEIESLINDEKKWSDVFTIKPYEYLEIIINGGEPWFDKPTSKWVDKKELEAKNEESDDEDSEYEESNHSEEDSEDLPF